MDQRFVAEHEPDEAGPKRGLPEYKFMISPAGGCRIDKDNWCLVKTINAVKYEYTDRLSSEQWLGHLVRCSLQLLIVMMAAPTSSWM
jgi:hypothetical protein